MTQRRSKESVRATGKKTRSKKTQADAKKTRKPKKPMHKNSVATQFKPGNQLWRLSHLKTQHFHSADELWQAACDYFDWADSNPLREQVAAQFQGAYVKDFVEKMRPYTIDGMCAFLGIGRDRFYDWEKSEILAPAIARIRTVMYEQKFSGAAAGLLNPVIIARDLGLKEQSETTGAMVLTEAKTPEQAREHLALFNQVLEKAVGNAA